MSISSRTPGQALSTRCPSCGHTHARQILAVPSAPVMVATVFPTADEARQVAGGRIELVGCTACGFLFNNDFDLELALSGSQYESSQAASAHFNAFSRGLAEGWVQTYGLQGKHILEVGFGAGDFMVEMLKAGCASAEGIDPLAEFAVFPPEHAAQVSFENAFFEDRHIDRRADALICRHALEHIPDVQVFLRRVAAWSRANGCAPLLFEVPAADRIVDEVAFWDVFYEHCCYFSEAALRTAFEVAGMDVLDLKLAYGNQYLLLEAKARPDGASKTVVADAAAGWIERCVRFGESTDRIVAACREQMTGFAAEPGGIVVWQGAAKTVSLMSFIGPGVQVRYAVDQNTRRHGQHLPPFGTRVEPPAVLASARPAHVVLMNPVYFREVRAQLDAMGLENTRLHTIDTLAAMT